MVTPGYTAGYKCNLCDMFLTDETKAQEHAKIPVFDPFPIGLVLKTDDSTLDTYLIITSKEKLTQGGDQPHERVYGTSRFLPYGCLETQLHDSPPYYADNIKTGLEKGSLKELSEEEFKKVLEILKGNTFLRIELHESPEKILTKTVPLEQIANRD